MLKFKKYGIQKIFLAFIGMLLTLSLLIGQQVLAAEHSNPQPVLGSSKPGPDKHQLGPDKHQPGPDKHQPGPGIPMPPLPPGIPQPPPFKLFPQLPSGHQSVQVGNDQYYYHHSDGAFYHKHPSGYITVRAPFGAIVFNIPIGSRAIMSGGLTYYVYDDVYYRRAGTQYVVVEPPRETVIINEVSPVVPSEPNVGEKVLVTAPLLNIRSGPGMNFPVVREVGQGTLLTIHGYAPDWLYVQLASGEFGWAMVKFTAPLAPPANG